MRWRTICAVVLLAGASLATARVNRLLMAEPRPVPLTASQQEADLHTLAGLLGG